MAKQIKIVIAGAGFAGLFAALALEKQFKKNKAVSITLVDRHDYHLFMPNLHEVATAAEELTGIGQLKKSIAVPLKEILAGRRITLAKGDVTEVMSAQKKIKAGRKILEYDYLVLALGLAPDYFNIEGAGQYGLPLAGLADALRIRNAVEFAVQSGRLDPARKTMRFVIAGGGGSAVEFAGELKGLLDFTAWKNSYPRENMEIVMLESAGSLLNGFDDRIVRDAALRLKEMGIIVEKGKIISRVERNFVEFMSTERMQYDVLAWMAGERAPEIKFDRQVSTDRKGRLKSDLNLRLSGSHNIFVLGDLGVIVDGDGRELPGGGAQRALKQAEYFAANLPALMENRKPAGFAYKPLGYVLNIGGKWALACTGKKYWTGYPAYWLGQLIRLNYYRKITGWKKAVMYWRLDRQLYGRND